MKTKNFKCFSNGHRSFLWLFLQSFPELSSKADRLQQVVQSHKTMQKSETDAVLFGRQSDSDAAQTSSKDTSILHGDQHSGSLNSMDFMWWGGPKRKSQPPERFGASKNS